MKRKTTVRKPAAWQLDPRSIETSNVQYWRNGKPFRVTADSNFLACRAATVGLSADKIEDNETLTHAIATVERHSEVAEFVAIAVELNPELAAMAADLDNVRAGKVELVAHMGPATLDAIRQEHVGKDFSEQPYNY